MIGLAVKARPRPARPRPPRKPAVAPELPRGDAIRRELKVTFRAQRNACLRRLGQPARKTADDLRGVPAGVGRRLPAWLVLAVAPRAPLALKAAPGPIRPADIDAINFPDLALGTLAMSERMTPHLELLWDNAGKEFTSRIGLDPDAWEVTDPNTAAMIEAAALDFCEATNATTSLDLAEALRRTREELRAGIVDRGESIPKLTKRINAIFDKAETSRARRIAQTEASRAVHAAQEESARQSGVVAGWEWVVSSDACPYCLRIAAEVRAVQLGQPFAVAGDHPSYSQVRMPPAHPFCACSASPVLSPEFGGPEDMAWGATLLQPGADGQPEGAPAPARPPEAEPPLLPAHPFNDYRSLGVEFKPSERAADHKAPTVVVDVAKLDAAWAKDTAYYIPPGGGGAEIQGRMAEFRAYLARARAEGLPIEQPEITIDKDGVASFSDGRHRFAVLRDMGTANLPVSVDKADARRARRLLGHKPKPSEAAPR